MSVKTQSIPRLKQFTERDKLARDLFLKLSDSHSMAGREASYVAEIAIQKADLFFDVLESRNNL